MSSSIKTLAEIPTLTKRYNTSLVSQYSSSPAKVRPSASINDRVSILRGDITKLQVDAIVNAANSALRGGGGVDGAIHRAAGPDLLAECVAVAPAGCPTGQAVITGGHSLPARFVIHAVGPVYRGAQSAEPQLRSCYETALRLAESEGLTSVAFSGISTGIYGYPSKDAARVACETVRKYLEADQTGKIQRVVFVTFEQKDVAAYDDLLPQYFPPAGAN